MVRIVIIQIIMKKTFNINDCKTCSTPMLETFTGEIPENKSTNEEYNIITEFDKVINKTKWIDAEDYYEIEPFLRQAQIEIERQAEEKGYQRGIEKGRKIGYADCLEKHEII